MKNDKLSRLFSNKTFLMVFSIAAAIFCWATVVLTISTETTRTIDNVPVTITSANTAYQALGLDIIDQKEQYVSVTVTGTRSVIGSLDATSFTVAPNLSSVTAPGTYDVPLTVAKNNQLQDYTVVSVTPSQLTLRFDTAISKKFAVTSEVVGLTAAQGLIAEQATVSPLEVTVTGPESEVNEISSVVARAVVNATLSETYKSEVKLVLRDADGNDINSGSLHIEPETADITVPVLKQGMLSLKIDFTNVPEGFDTSTLKYTMSRTEIPIAAASSVIDNLRPKVIGYVDLAAFDLDKVYTFDIELSSGTVNIDNVSQVTVNFRKDDFATKKVNVTDIRVVNCPANYKVNVKTESISAVTLIGTGADFDNILAGSVVALVDMNSLGGIDTGEFNVPVTFIVTSTDSAWVAGSYSVLIEVTAE